jgi:hypothetical protein
MIAVNTYCPWAVAALLAVPVCGAAPGPKDVRPPPELASQGSTDYRIVFAGADSAAGLHAARELARYLEALSGADFPVVGEADGTGPLFRLRLVPEDRETGTEGFRITTGEHGVILTAGHPRGLHNAVHYLLDRHLGVRWYAPDHVHLPEPSHLRLPAIDETQIPRFAYREVFARGGDDPGFSAHNRLNGRFGHRLAKASGEHPELFRTLDHVNVFSLVPPSQYRAPHPEYYGGGQLQYARPAVREIAAEAVLKRLDERRDDRLPAYLLIEHADRATYFDQGPDGELIERHGAPAAAYLDFVRHIAGAVAQRYPEVRVLAQAYLWSRKPPRNMSLPDNMGIMFSGIERDHGQPLAAKANAAVLADLKGWGRLTDHVLVWTYHTNFASYLQPYPNLHTFGPDARLLADLDHVRGWFAQGAYNTPGAALSPLRTWVLSRLMWAPDSDPDRLIESFLLGYYGDAVPFLADYITLMEAAIKRSGTPLATKVAADAPYLDADTLHRADRLFTAAEKAVAEEERHLRHVRTARMSVDFAILASQPAIDGPEWVRHEERLARLKRYLEHSGMRAYREGRGHPPSELIDALAIRRTAPPEPTVCQGRRAVDCVSVQDLSFDLAGGATVVEDAAASDQAAARQEGDRRAWGIQLPLFRLLPGEGGWRIYVQLRAAGPDTDKVLLHAGVYPGRQRAIEAVAAHPHVKKVVPGPIDAGGMSPKSVELAGRFADGWVPQLFTAEALEARLEDFRRGAELGDRDLDDLRVAVTVRSCVLDDTERTREVARRQLAFMIGAYGPYYRQSIAEQGFEAATDSVREAWTEGDREAVFDTLEEIVANDVVREYADKHGVYAPAEVGVEVNVPPVEECPTLEEVRDVLEAGEGAEGLRAVAALLERAVTLEFEVEQVLFLERRVAQLRREFVKTPVPPPLVVGRVRDDPFDSHVVVFVHQFETLPTEGPTSQVNYRDHTSIWALKGNKN